MPENVDLRAHLKESMLSQLEHVEIQLTAHAALLGSDISDHGTMEWSGSAGVRVFEHDSDDDKQPWHSMDGASFSVEHEEPDTSFHTIFRARGLKIDLQEVVDIFDALDARSAEYAEFIPMFGESKTFGSLDLDPDLEEVLEIPGREVVIIDHVELAPAWRGLGGVGRVLASRMFRWASVDAYFYALKPFPIELDQEQKDDANQFNPALSRVRDIWQSLGFVPFTNDIWYMDPKLNSHQLAVRKLERTLGLRPGSQ